MSEPIRSTNPCIFNVTVVTGNTVEHHFRYDWIVIDDDGTVRSNKFNEAPEIEEIDKVYIYNLAPSHCRDLGVDSGSSIKYDGTSMQFVDRDTVRRIINL